MEADLLEFFKKISVKIPKVAKKKYVKKHLRRKVCAAFVEGRKNTTNEHFTRVKLGCKRKWLVGCMTLNLLHDNRINTCWKTRLSVFIAIFCQKEKTHFLHRQTVWHCLSFRFLLDCHTYLQKQLRRPRKSMNIKR